MFKSGKLLLLAPLAWLLSIFSSRNPSITENAYSGTIFPVIARVLSAFTHLLPFSVAEIALFALAAYIVTKITLIIKHRRLELASGALKIMITLSLTYFAFVALWGLNYHRLPFSQIAGLDVRNIQKAELVAVCEKLIEQVNSLRAEVLENDQGVMQLLDTPHQALKRAQKGYDQAAEFYPELRHSYSSPKGALYSTPLSYMGIAGIYSPFTGEAHVNINMPHSAIPATAAHEVAHQHGFNREDEANFIGYLTCILHPDPDYQYSGALMALKYAMNALVQQDAEKFIELRSRYSPQVARDLAHERLFWEQYQGPVERAADRVNDAYLRANMQEDGVLSYGRMVDLLIGFHRAGNLNTFERRS